MIPVLNKIEITIDFNGPRGQTLSFKYWKYQNGESFSNFVKFIIVNNLHCNLFHSVKWVQ